MPSSRPDAGRAVPAYWRSRHHVLSVLGLAWATLALRVTRRRLQREGLRAEAPPPRGLPRACGRGVESALHRLPNTCLERGMVRQRWLHHVGEDRDLVIGVAKDPEKGFAAHAWLDDEARPDALAAGYTELLRRHAA